MFVISCRVVSFCRCAYHVLQGCHQEHIRRQTKRSNRFEWCVSMSGFRTDALTISTVLESLRNAAPAEASLQQRVALASVLGTVFAQQDLVKELLRQKAASTQVCIACTLCSAAGVRQRPHFCIESALTLCRSLHRSAGSQCSWLPQRCIAAGMV